MMVQCEACYRLYSACEFAPKRKHFLCSGLCIIQFKNGKVKCKDCEKNWKLKNQIVCDSCHELCKPEIMTLGGKC